MIFRSNILYICVCAYVCMYVSYIYIYIYIYIKSWYLGTRDFPSTELLTYNKQLSETAIMLLYIYISIYKYRYRYMYIVEKYSCWGLGRNAYLLLYSVYSKSITLTAKTIATGTTVFSILLYHHNIFVTLFLTLQNALPNFNTTPPINMFVDL